MIAKIKILKIIDKFAASILQSLLCQAAYKAPPKSINKVLIIRPGGMGDAALLIPILKEIRMTYPNLIIDILCEKRNSGIFSSISFCNTIYYYDNVKHFLKIITTLSYDIIIDTEQSHFLSALLCRIMKSKYTIGYNSHGRGRLFNKPINYEENEYETLVFRKLFEGLLVKKKKFTWQYPYLKQSPFKAKELLPNDKNICLFPGATKNECKWAEKKWALLIDKLSDDGFVPTLIGGQLEERNIEEIISYCKTSKIINYCNRLSLLETTGLFKISQILISTDSGILHLGVLANIPTLSLFGAGNQTKWAPIGEKHSVINKKLPCSPCALFGTIPKCNNKIACMESITCDDVYHEAISMLDI